MTPLPGIAKFNIHFEQSVGRMFTGEEAQKLERIHEGTLDVQAELVRPSANEPG